MVGAGKKKKLAMISEIHSLGSSARSLFSSWGNSPTQMGASQFGMERGRRRAHDVSDSFGTEEGEEEKNNGDEEEKGKEVGFETNGFVHARAFGVGEFLDNHATRTRGNKTSNNNFNAKKLAPQQAEEGSTVWARHGYGANGDLGCTGKNDENRNENENAGRNQESNYSDTWTEYDVSECTGWHNGEESYADSFVLNQTKAESALYKLSVAGYGEGFGGYLKGNDVLMGGGPSCQTELFEFRESKDLHRVQKRKRSGDDDGVGAGAGETAGKLQRKARKRGKLLVEDERSAASSDEDANWQEFLGLL